MFTRGCLAVLLPYCFLVMVPVMPVMAYARWSQAWDHSEFLLQLFNHGLRTAQNFTLLYVVQLAFTSSGDHYTHIYEAVRYMTLYDIFVPAASQAMVKFLIYHHQCSSECSMSLIIAKSYRKVDWNAQLFATRWSRWDKIPRFCLIIYHLFIWADSKFLPPTYTLASCNRGLGNHLLSRPRHNWRSTTTWCSWGREGWSHYWPQ